MCHEAFVEVDLNNSRLRSMARGNDEFLDTVEGEITFFRSLMRARPVGLHKHFHALSMRTAIHQDTGHYVTLDAIWKKLNDLYNLKALEDLVRYCANCLRFIAYSYHRTLKGMILLKERHTPAYPRQTPTRT